MKQCFKCHQEKPLRDYYKHPQMKDGHLNKCKDCTKSDVSAHRLENLAQIRAKDRIRGITDAHRAKVRENYRKRISTAKGKKRELSRKKAWNEKNAEKRAAHIILGNALRDGRVVKSPCVRCGSIKNVHGHHEDYGKPLEVMWLCQKHHGERHREINESRRKGVDF